MLQTNFGEILCFKTQPQREELLFSDMTTSQNGQIPHFPKFNRQKIVLQLKNNGHKLFYTSEMDICEVHYQNFASYEQKTVLA